ncbi:hypothetical protein GGI20_005028 [Coemansia sp. BCRC 34301]|nr:hypothetical protein GGI20_005028 [Coemansia sp. BCRC 34301]
MSLRVLAAKHNSALRVSSRATALQCRHASILGPGHRHRSPPPPPPPTRNSPTGGVSSSSQQQRQQQSMTSTTHQNRQASIGNFGRPSPRVPVVPANRYIFRHRGTVPSEPQSIDCLQFILNQKPLGATALLSGEDGGARLFMLSSSSLASNSQTGTTVRTADEARERARIKLEELNDIVQSASGLVVALSAAAKVHLAAAPQPVVVETCAPSSSSPIAMAAVAKQTTNPGAAGSMGFSRRNVLSALGIGGAAVCLGVLLAPEFVGIL